VGDNTNLAIKERADRKFRDFLLDRLTHDLSNSIGGIFSLSDHHLRVGFNDMASLQESLQLIYQTCEESRKLLLLVGQLLNSEETEPDLIRVSTLLTEVGGMLTALLPRSVTLLHESPPVDGVVRVDRILFVRSFAQLASLALPKTGAVSTEIAFGATVGPEIAAIYFRSGFAQNEEFAPEVKQLFANLHCPEDIGISKEGGLFRLVLNLRLVSL
jgi:hypothetical protein